jgi:hypothetical protein
LTILVIQNSFLSKNMPKISQIRGMLLEEALLYLLRVSGYRTIEQVDDADLTLQLGPAGLEVKGRGSVHQIDAIADYIVAHPFSHPQRLLVEAKCYKVNSKTGIEVMRNAIGVLKDVGEFWVSRGKNGPFKKRYHYQYALFSASDYTADAEAYAYAQDIYLIPLARSRFIQPLIQAIRALTPIDFGLESERNSVDLSLSELRRAVRQDLQNPIGPELLRIVIANIPIALDKIERFIQECRRLNQAILAMIARQIPVFLAPSPEVNVANLDDEYQVRIYWDQEGWYLRDIYNRRLFSFDLPPTLFELYATEGTLSRENALNLKGDFLSTIQAVVTANERTRIVTFNLDREWLDTLRRQTRRQAKLPDME